MENGTHVIVTQECPDVEYHGKSGTVTGQGGAGGRIVNVLLDGDERDTVFAVSELREA